MLVTVNNVTQVLKGGRERRPGAGGSLGSLEGVRGVCACVGTLSPLQAMILTLDGLSDPRGKV